LSVFKEETTFGCFLFFFSLVSVIIHIGPSCLLPQSLYLLDSITPAVSSETTFWEMWALVLLANPVVARGNPKSVLKLFNERTELITPVSYPVVRNRS